MKSILAAVSLTFALSLPLRAEEAKQELIVQAPANWKVTFNGEKGLQFYTVTGPAGETALLMFSRWPAPSSVKEIPGQIDSMAKAFVGTVKGNKDLKLKTEQYKVEELVGDTFTGNFVQFEIEGGIVQTLFLIGDEHGVWNGQFTGTKEGWAQAMTTLKTLKKKE